MTQAHGIAICVTVRLLILGFALASPMVALGQPNAPENPLRWAGIDTAPPAASKNPRARKLAPIKIRTALPVEFESDQGDALDKSVQQAANDEPADPSAFGRSRAKSYELAHESDDSTSDQAGVAAAPSSRRQPVTLHISDDEGETVQEADRIPVQEKSVFESDREALSALVKFGPARPAVSTSVRPALVQRAQPNGFRSGDIIFGEEIPQIPAPTAGGYLSDDEPEELAQGRKSDFKPITELRVDIASKDKDIKPGQRNRPDSAATTFFGDVKPVYQSVGYRREWAQSGYSWVAPGMCHGPLYFEEVNLERHGLSFGLIQPGVSFLNFYGKLIILPYQMAATYPRECVYTLGYYRPGSYAPFQLHYPPPSLKGAGAEAAVIAALFLILP